MMTFNRILVSAVLGVAIAGGAWANTIDALVAELRSDSEAARVHARQMLPREGVDALPVVLPLINHENESVWRAAYNVVAEIANEACAPGHEAERHRAVELLTIWLAPDQTPRAHEYGLRLIRYVVPEGYPVESIAPFLQDADLREYARGALEVIATTEARLALESALESADAGFRSSLLVSLEQIGSEASLPAFVRAMNDEDAGVRVAAARGAVQFARPSLAGQIYGVQANATPETEFEANDAVLRFADALAASGGNWTLAMKTYISVLEYTNEPVPVCGAMMGLGRYGDENVVPVLLAKAADANNREVLGALPLALGALHGRAATEVIVAHYGSVPEPVRPAVLRSLGTATDPAVAGLIQDGLTHPEPAYRMAALEAAQSMGAAALLGPLMRLAEQSEGAERAQAVRAALAIARSGAQAESAAEAGEALVRLYSYADDNATRSEVLSALSKNPNADALPLAMDALKTHELSGAALPLLVALVPSLVAEGDSQGAHEVVSAVMAANGSPRQIVEMAAGLGASADALGLPDLLGVLCRWHVIGPFSWENDDDWTRAFVNEPGVDLGAAIDGKTWNAVATSDPLGMVDLVAQFGMLSRVFAYAYTSVESAAACDAQLRIGSDDGVVAWVNGDKVWENRVDRGMRVDEDVVPVKLNQGTNTILLKISQGAGGWNFCCRVTDPSGMGVRQP